MATQILKRIDKVLAKLVEEVESRAACDIPRSLTLNIVDLANARRALAASAAPAEAKSATAAAAAAAAAPASAPEPPPPPAKGPRPLWEIRGLTQEESDEEWNVRYRLYNAERIAAEAAGLPPPLVMGSKYETEEARVERLVVYDDSINLWHKRREEDSQSEIRAG